MSSIGTRAERTLATRRRMVAAAYRLFCSNGYLGTTMNAIADQAGVAVQTLYYTFHTKAALLDEALGAAIVGFDSWQEPPPDPEIAELLPWHAWWADFQAAPSSAEALHVFVTHGIEILERVGPLVTAMRGGAGDPEAAAVVELGEERRLAAYRVAIQTLADKHGGLRPGLDEAAATDILFVLFSADLYQALSTGRGWIPARCTQFFAEMLTAQLLGHQQPGDRNSRRWR